MCEAISLAKKGLGRTSPNPAVGAVVVRGGKVVARGWHKKAGLAHAEIEALREAGPAAKGATLFVTLEPCCHFGRTPPCTEAVIASGVRRVVIGAHDPNPLVAGKGAAALRAAGIEVIEGVLADECAAFNEAYNKYITTGRPFVTLKLAASIDGRIAAPGGESRWITGPDSRRLVHRMRVHSDAVLVGAETALKDDPELTVRLVRGRNPARVVLDSALRLPASAKLYNGVREGRERLLIFTSAKAGKGRVEKARGAGAEVIKVPSGAKGLSLRKVLKELAAREITSVLVEGGGAIAASLLKDGLVDRLSVFVGPMVLGADSLAAVGQLGLRGLSRAPRLKRMSVRKVGEDILIEGDIN